MKAVPLNRERRGRSAHERIGRIKDKGIQKPDNEITDITNGALRGNYAGIVLDAMITFVNCKPSISSLLWRSRKNLRFIRLHYRKGQPGTTGG